jgi:hypothetical protein
VSVGPLLGDCKGLAWMVHAHVLFCPALTEFASLFACMWGGGATPLVSFPICCLGLFLLPRLCVFPLRFVVAHRYSIFRPEMYWWRLVLTGRKLAMVVVALMFSSTPLFQAWCVSLQDVLPPWDGA